MPYLYTASQVPAPTVLSTPPSIADCTSAETTAGTIANYPKQWVSEWANQLAAMIAGLATWGGTACGTINGLELSTASGILMTVTAGNANIGGIVPFAGGTITVPDATELGFIWIHQNGTLDVTTTTDAPAGSAAVCIGNFTTFGGNITVVDYSGVVYLFNGAAVRYTNDALVPADTPSSLWRGMTIGASNVPITWDGANYWPQVPAMVTAKTMDYNVLASDAGTSFTNAGASGLVTFTLPTCYAGAGPFSFQAENDNGIAVNAPTGATVRIGAQAQSASGGAVTSYSPEAGVTLIGISDTEYVASAGPAGVWTPELPQFITTVAKTSDYAVQTNDGNKYFTTTGATGEVDFTLPVPGDAGAGPFHFANNSATAQVMKIIAPAGVTIQAQSLTSSAAGYIEQTGIGDFVSLIALSTTLYIAVAMSTVGNWSAA